MDEEGAINFAADQGHRGAEVLQGSWELFFKVMLICPHSNSVLQVKWKCFSFKISIDLNEIVNFWPRLDLFKCMVFCEILLIGLT